MYYNLLQFTLVYVILNEFVQAKPNNKIQPITTCTAITELDDKKNDLKVSYDCSDQQLNWPGLENIIDSARSATSLNLASNNFDPIVYNKSFNLFKTLSNTLNLSSNSLNEIESHAFYYEVQLTQSNGNLAPLQISSLDLSYNYFTYIPWLSVASLPNLQYLYLNQNKNLTSFDMADLVILNDKKEYSIFAMLTHIYLQSCEIKYVDHKILKYLSNLILLDLSSNNLKNLDAQVGIQLTFNNDMQILSDRYTSLNLKNNPLQCDCKLLWLKRYLLKYGKDSEQYCMIRQSVKPINSNPTVVSVETVYLDGQNNKGQRIDLESEEAKEEEQIFYSEKEKQESIIKLNNDLFICDIEFQSEVKKTEVKRIKTNLFRIQLTCVVNGYPRPVIRWNEGNKALHKNIDKIIETESETSDLSDSYTVTSYLVLEKPYETSNEIEYRNYSCRTKFDPALNLPEYNNQNQKMILFKIFNSEKDNYAAAHRLQVARTHEHDDQLQQQQQQQQQQPPQTKQINAKKKSDTYWFILLLCILVAFIFMLFASVCIIRNVAQSNRLEKKIIEKEKAFNAKRNSTYSYTQTSSGGMASTSEKRQTTSYSTSTTTSTTRNSTLGLLKPDVIRPHHDYSSSFNINSTNRTASSRHSSPNSNSLFFSSPISLVAANKQQQQQQNDSNELDNLLENNNQSYDNHPIIDNSLLFDDSSSSTSSKSFDENIEQYQEPQFDDLSKPVSNNKKPSNIEQS